MTFLLEATQVLVPSWVMGLCFLLILLGALGWVVGFGSGRPHSK